jgi:hypothetical protein
MHPDKARHETALTEPTFSGVASKIQIHCGIRGLVDTSKKHAAISVLPGWVSGNFSFVRFWRF